MQVFDHKDSIKSAVNFKKKKVYFDYGCAMFNAFCIQCMMFDFELLDI